MAYRAPHPILSSFSGSSRLSPLIFDDRTTRTEYLYSCRHKTNINLRKNASYDAGAGAISCTFVPYFGALSARPQKGKSGNLPLPCQAHNDTLARLEKYADDNISTEEHIVGPPSDYTRNISLPPESNRRDNNASNLASLPVVATPEPSNEKSRDAPLNPISPYDQLITLPSHPSSTIRSQSWSSSLRTYFHICDNKSCG